MKTLASALASLVLLLGTGVAHAQTSRSGPTANGMRIRIIVAGTELQATLEDSPAARDFVAMLPLELTLEDYHATEKIADLPSRLSTDDAPAGVDPAIGDITYYAPWGNLALFYGISATRGVSYGLAGSKGTWRFSQARHRSRPGSNRSARQSDRCGPMETEVTANHPRDATSVPNA